MPFYLFIRGSWSYRGIIHIDVLPLEQILHNLLKVSPKPLASVYFRHTISHYQNLLNIHFSRILIQAGKRRLNDALTSVRREVASTSVQRYLDAVCLQGVAQQRKILLRLFTAQCHHHAIMGASSCI